MNKKHLSFLLIILIALVAYFTYYNPSQGKPSLNLGPVVGYASSSKYGSYLTDKTGRTLYILSSDKNLQSGCLGDCLKDWVIFEFDNQPLDSFEDALSKKLSFISREDGWYQYTYSGHPLYYYTGDSVPGATNGLFLKNHIGRLVALPEADLVY